MEGWILYKYAENESEQNPYWRKRFFEAAQKLNIDLKILDPEQIDLVVTRDDRNSVYVDQKAVPLPDFVLPRMGYKTTYFSLAVIRHLERLGVPCINTSESIETVKDKLYSQQILAQKHIPVPKTMLMKFPLDVDLIETNIKFPIVIKTLSGGEGKGVFLAENKKKFQDLMELIEVTNPNFNIIVQEYIESSHGRDLRVFVIGGKVVACMQRSASANEFRANVSIGGSTKQYPVSAEVEWLATQAASIFELDIAGVDLLFDKDHFKICEVNSSPGFQGVENCIDVKIPERIFEFIKFRYGMF